MSRTQEPCPGAFGRITACCERFDAAWSAGQQPRIEEYLDKVPSDERPALLRELIAHELRKLGECGQRPAKVGYFGRFPEQVDLVEAVFHRFEREVCGLSQTSDYVPGRGDCLNGDPPLRGGTCSDSPEAPDTASPFVGQAYEHEVDGRLPAGPASAPRRVGRFPIEGTLGRGAFGTVYLARDPQLMRMVALKVSRRADFSSETELGDFISEARAAAQLAHPGIVTIYDVGCDDGHVFIVQEYLSGHDLAHHLRSELPSTERAAEWARATAEAMAFAHLKGFVHRDLKPSNILFAENGTSRVADFGLAIHESVQRGHPGEYCGTPPYMSPEQVRGETHRLDGRSDIWSLGVILYEMLVGRRPFHGETRVELFDEIKHREPKPLRMIRPEVPAELERICLKCLAKRATDRYATAADLAEDLGHYLAGDVLEGQADQHPAPSRIVPKGLLSFGPEDAEFFLNLLPGPRDRNDMPECIRFWETRLRQQRSDQTSAVGVICGASGCGKSSLVRAGLLPRLDSAVSAIFVEATATDTAARLRKSLRARYPDLPDNLSLTAILKLLRERGRPPGGKKLLLVIDQFEQWLHGQRGDAACELAEALRQCDGDVLQCLLLVRDDFWLATSRFMESLEIDVLLGKNAAFVELFDKRHAADVLTKFGRAYGCLPEDELTNQQARFIERAVEGLAEEEKVICVRLSLFADMIKSKPWTTATLKQVGGADGLGVIFLEETFCASIAPAAHRYHQKAARAVLAALLPDADTEIRGRVRASEDLLAASGYSGRPARFRELMRILQDEVRLITPTDPAEISPDLELSAPSDSREYFQLTHDYLIPCLRTWLATKQSRAAQFASWCQHPHRINQAGIATVMVATAVLFFHVYLILLQCCYLVQESHSPHVSAPRIIAYFAALILIIDLPYLLLGVKVLNKRRAGIYGAIALDAMLLVVSFVFIAWPARFPQGIHTFGADQVVTHWSLIAAVITALAVSHILAAIAAAARRRPADGS